MLVNDPDGWLSDGQHGPVWWLGSDVPGGPIGPNGPFDAQVLPAVSRIVSLITDPLSVSPWQVVEDGFGGEVLSSPRFLDDPQLTRPDSRFPVPILPAVTRLPRSEFWSSWIRGAVLFGQCGVLLLEDADGVPLAGSLRIIQPQNLTATRDEAGVLCWEIGDGTDRIVADRDGYIAVGGLRWRVVVLRDPHASMDNDGHTPSVFERHPAAFGTATAIEGYMRGVYAAGVPSGVLSVNQPTPITQPQADSLKRAWMAAHGGSAKSVAVLASTVQFTPISISPVDAALIESKRASMADLCLAFCLDPQGALGISLGNSGTYANVQQYFARLKSDLLPWISAVEQTVSALLPAGRSVRMDFSQYTRPDPRDQYEALQIAVSAGLLTLDEARNILGLPELPEPEPAPVPVELAPVDEPAPPEPVRALRKELAWRR
jgi:phage portal protein BeeE